jgi:hypothetical protein
MTHDAESLRRRLSTAHAEALRVGDSPIRADRAADQLEALARELDGASLTEEQLARVGSALADAVRVLRRDDDGREAARHLQAATRVLEPRERKPSQFGDES